MDRWQITRAGYSLVEIAIALTIAGAIIGGVLAGQNLIKNSELQKTMTEIHDYRTAFFSFKDKYNALPGDMMNATQFFTDVSNGDGNGVILWYNEGLQAWVEMVQTGLVKGDYAGGWSAIPGVSVPQSSYHAKGGYSFAFEETGNAITADNNMGTVGNVIHFGGESPSYTTKAPILVPDDAKAIDEKLDDGLPETGFIRSWGNMWNPGCSTGVNGNRVYAEQTSAELCSLLIGLE